jgi:phosphoglycolate phosphatase
MATIVFDFDGVIADSNAAVLKALQEIAELKGVPPISESEHRALSTRELFSRLRIRWWQIPRFVKLARRLVHKNRACITLHSQARPVLEWALSDAGAKLTILSTNSEGLIRDILAREAPHIQDARVIGSVSVFGKHRRLRKLAREPGVRAQRFVYIGDEVRDVVAARRAGVESVAVTWGKDGRELLSAARPSYQVETGSELVEVLGNLR